MRPATRLNVAAAAGFSLIELLVAMSLLTIIMGATLSGLANVMKGNELVMTVSSMNGNLRAGMDVMIRDLLQTGSGLPGSHTVQIPSGANSVRVRIPGPPGTAFETLVTDLVLPAVLPRAGAGPTINGVATDVLTVLMADNTFLEVGVTAMTDTQVTVAAGPNLTVGADRIVKGQLILISKGSVNTLVQVTNDVDAAARILQFADGDSLRLNQSTAANGSLRALNLAEPLDKPATAGVNEAIANTRISRMRMITYYLDNTTDPMHPRLVRRVNNGHHTNFSNTSGTAVAVDVMNMQLTYDISNGVGNPGGVEMTTTDQGTGGACAPLACARTQIRKVNMSMTARAPNLVSGSTTFLRNTLDSQVSLRAMAFVDRYNPGQ